MTTLRRLNVPLKHDTELFDEFASQTFTELVAAADRMMGSKMESGSHIRRSLRKAVRGKLRDFIVENGHIGPSASVQRKRWRAAQLGKKVRPAIDERPADMPETVDSLIPYNGLDSGERRECAAHDFDMNPDISDDRDRRSRPDHWRLVDAVEDAATAVATGKVAVAIDYLLADTSHSMRDAADRVELPESTLRGQIAKLKTLVRSYLNVRDEYAAGLLSDYRTEVAVYKAYVAGMRAPAAERAKVRRQAEEKAKQVAFREAARLKAKHEAARREGKRQAKSKDSGDISRKSAVDSGNAPIIRIDRGGAPAQGRHSQSSFTSKPEPAFETTK
jgi:hypothetical protein